MSREHVLLERARQAPEQPGVYRFKDGRGKDIYVGKARSIRRRVLSYFGRSDLPERTAAMLARARSLDFTVTASEIEAFILENTLIKRLRPRFNVLLRDDKTYPYLLVTTGEQWPRVLLTRRVRDDGHSYFGPFMGQYMARRLLEVARTRFQVRTCHLDIDGSLERPCLYYSMRACLAPCVAGLTTPEQYLFAIVDGVEGHQVGSLWYGIRDEGGHRFAYLNDIWIAENYRRQGYSAAAMAAFEKSVAARGIDRILLHVFAHNPAAQALYDKVGYATSGIFLRKRLGD